MDIIKFFKNQKKCQHDKVLPSEDICYCPDCGELIENKWYICRCDCCGIKLKAIIKDGKVVPEERFCHNCGDKSFSVEQVPKINFIDINYAVLVKTIIAPQFSECTQSWLDRHEFSTTKLLMQT